MRSSRRIRDIYHRVSPETLVLSLQAIVFEHFKKRGRDSFPVRITYQLGKVEGLRRITGFSEDSMFLEIFDPGTGKYHPNHVMIKNFVNKYYVESIEAKRFESGSTPFSIHIVFKDLPFDEWH